MTKLAFISDTHMQHARLTQFVAPERPDVLVHCGDFTNICGLHEVLSFSEWCLMLLKKEYVGAVVVIAGNHDALFDPKSQLSYRHGDPQTAERLCATFRLASVTYLQDSAAVVAGVKFYGSPWTKRFYDWGFQIDSEEQDRRIFGAVPEDTDVLLTHGPPLGVRDRCPRDGGTFENVGSGALLEALKRAKPRVHAFGHIHETAGLSLMPWGTLCVNAASCMRSPDRVVVRPPVVIELPERQAGS